MLFNDHSNLAGSHALFSPSSPHWLNYTDEKLDRFFVTSQEARRGTILHNFARDAILLGEKLNKIERTLNMYVNDCIGWKLTPEQILFYSHSCYGSADAVGYSERMKKLRISDLKNGYSPTDMRQLLLYAALFCLEYAIDPRDIETELRIYQNNAIKLEIPDPIDIFQTMERIKYVDAHYDEFLREAPL